MVTERLWKKRVWLVLTVFFRSVIVHLQDPMLSPRESEHTLFLFHLAAIQQPLSLPEGEITTIEIHRSNPYIQLGISIVGGNETPLINIVIQEVYRDGVIARDGRLLAGDQILQVTLTTLLVLQLRQL